MEGTDQSVVPTRAASEGEGRFPRSRTATATSDATETVHPVEWSPAPYDRQFGRFPTQLGSGASKFVYEAIDEVNGKLVAWNEVPLACLTEEERKRVIAEIEILKEVKHERIIDFYAAWSTPEKLVFITAICDGGDLQSFYRQHARAVKLKVIKKWCRQILCGIEYLHSFVPPIIHRDIKCENVLYEASGAVKIGDLGLCTRVKSDDNNVDLGTPQYMAPELYDGTYTESVDIYAFGMTVLEMVTKRLPYCECNNYAQIFKMVTRGILPEAFHRIRYDSIKEFIKFCITRREDGNRPSATEVLRHPFLDDHMHSAEDEEVDLVWPEETAGDDEEAYSDSASLSLDLDADSLDVVATESEGTAGKQSLPLHDPEQFERAGQLHYDTTAEYNSSHYATNSAAVDFRPHADRAGLEEYDATPAVDTGQLFSPLTQPDMSFANHLDRPAGTSNDGLDEMLSTTSQQGLQREDQHSAGGSPFFGGSSAMFPNEHHAHFTDNPHTGDEEYVDFGDGVDRAASSELDPYLQHTGGHSGEYGSLLSPGYEMASLSTSRALDVDRGDASVTPSFLPYEPASSARDGFSHYASESYYTDIPQGELGSPRHYDGYGRHHDDNDHLGKPNGADASQAADHVDKAEGDVEYVDGYDHGDSMRARTYSDLQQHDDVAFAQTERHHGQGESLGASHHEMMNGTVHLSLEAGAGQTLNGHEELSPAQDGGDYLHEAYNTYTTAEEMAAARVGVDASLPEATLPLAARRLSGGALVDSVLVNADAAHGPTELAPVTIVPGREMPTSTGGPGASMMTIQSGFPVAASPATAARMHAIVLDAVATVAPGPAGHIGRTRVSQEFISPLSASSVGHQVNPSPLSLPYPGTTRADMGRHPSSGQDITLLTLQIIHDEQKNGSFSRALITFEFDRNVNDTTSTAKEVVQSLMDLQQLEIDETCIPMLAAFLATMRFDTHVDITTGPVTRFRWHSLSLKPALSLAAGVPDMGNTLQEVIPSSPMMIAADGTLDDGLGPARGNSMSTLVLAGNDKVTEGSTDGLGGTASDASTAVEDSASFVGLSTDNLNAESVTSTGVAYATTPLLVATLQSPTFFYNETPRPTVEHVPGAHLTSTSHVSAAETDHSYLGSSGSYATVIVNSSIPSYTPFSTRPTPSDAFSPNAADVHGESAQVLSSPGAWQESRTTDNVSIVSPPASTADNVNGVMSTDTTPVVTLTASVDLQPAGSSSAFSTGRTGAQQTDLEVVKGEEAEGPPISDAVRPGGRESTNASPKVLTVRGMPLAQKLAPAPLPKSSVGPDPIDMMISQFIGADGDVLGRTRGNSESQKSPKDLSPKDVSAGAPRPTASLPSSAYMALGSTAIGQSVLPPVHSAAAGVVPSPHAPSAYWHLSQLPQLHHSHSFPAALSASTHHEEPFGALVHPSHSLGDATFQAWQHIPGGPALSRQTTR